MISQINLRGIPCVARIAVLFLVCGIASAAPRIEADQPVWNFGAVTNLAELTHDFVIRNTGDAPLEINRVLSSCSACLLVGIGKTNLPPGGTTAVQGRLDLRLLSGHLSRTILVECNDSLTPSLVFELNGFVAPAYQMIPPGINLDLSRGQSSGVMEIFPLLKTNISLSHVTCDDPNLTVTLSAKTNAGFLLAGQVDKNIPRGDKVIPLTLRSSDTNDFPCRVIVFIHHPPGLELIPSQLRFLPLAAQQTRILWLKQHDVEPWTLLDAVPSSDKYHCEIDPDPVGMDYRIYVSAWQQEACAGQTNALLLKFADAPGGKARSMTIPMSVESR